MTSNCKLNPQRCQVIACATVTEELRPLLPPGLKCEVMEFGLHVDPAKLKIRLQQKIDSLPENIDQVVLGYGLCSQAVTGLSSPTRTLIVPRVDDCIALFLGSVAEYARQHKEAPGTLYETKGWLEGGNSPLDEQAELARRFGVQKAQALYHQMIKNYTRLVFINTGNYEIEHYRERSRHIASELNLNYEEIKGSNAILRQLLYGPWDRNIIVVPPGRSIAFSDFR